MYESDTRLSLNSWGLPSAHSTCLDRNYVRRDDPNHELIVKDGIAACGVLVPALLTAALARARAIDTRVALDDTKGVLGGVVGIDLSQGSPRPAAASIMDTATDALHAHQFSGRLCHLKSVPGEHEQMKLERARGPRKHSKRSSASVHFRAVRPIALRGTREIRTPSMP
jgi:hypothetical protein